MLTNFKKFMKNSLIEMFKIMLKINKNYLTNLFSEFISESFGKLIISYWIFCI